MNLRTAIFITALFFIVGMVIGYSLFKPKVITECPPTSSQGITIRDTVFKVKTDTIKIPIERIRYFTKVDTVTVYDTFEYDDTKRTPRLLDCVSFPLLLSDSSLIEVTECSEDSLPLDITYDAKYIDKREKIRVVESVRVDTVKINNKKILGFTIGPSAGVGIDINNIKQPVYFMGVTMTYGWRF